MAVVFQVRGTSLNAYYSSSGKTPGLFFNDANGAAATAAGTSFGSSDIAMTLASSTAHRGLIYPGLNNLSNNAAFAVLIRIKPNYTGSPANNRGLWQFTSGITSSSFGTTRLYHTTAGKLYLLASRCSDGLDCTDAATTAGWSPTSGTYYDIMVSWDGTGSANTIKFSIDGVELETRSPTSSRARTGQDVKFTPGIIVGANYNIAGMNASLNEFVVFDNAENHVYSARSDFWTASSFDGQLNTGAGAGNIRSGSSEVIAGVTTNGTLVVPTLANTKTGVAGDGGTGTYDGSDRWTAPTVSDLRSGIQLKNNSTSLNLTGTLTVPSLANTKTGVAGDGGTGTYDGSDRWTAPSAGDLRSGTQLKNNSTSLNLTGTLVAPSLANTKTGVAGDGGTGTYDGSDRWTSPTAGQLESGVQLKSNSTSLNLTGTLVKAAKATTKIGVAADDGTGEYYAAERWTDLDAGDVRADLAYKANSATENKTGTLTEGASAEEIAAAVWDAATVGHSTSGTFGSLMQRLLTLSQFLGFQ